ncbi:MAG TPA: NAD(P)H-hydrate dehydratase [Allosphingosinicella sp.]|nr:NAD(P)H-hydrate dehydratase [Allosphingosinicella sp.]
MKGRPIVTAAEMRAAEAAVIATGISTETLMDRAGRAAAEALANYAGARPSLVICGPGNNGGDGYVIACQLRRQGIDVRVAALSEPKSAAAAWARSAWPGDVERLDAARPAPVLVDALFGTGLTRPLDDMAVRAMLRLAGEARVRVAVDLPSGAATDDGRLLSPVPDYDLTVTFGAIKPSHLLQPCARHVGRLVVADIGIGAASRLHEIARPTLRPPRADDHKYSRGYVAVVAGDMPGAAALAAAAALRSGAGYVRLVSNLILETLPNAIIQGGRWEDRDPRIGAVVIGPGLGRGPDNARLFDHVLATGHALVLDADALTLLTGRFDMLRGGNGPAILTPHAGEFQRLFGSFPGSKVEQARAAAALAGAVIVFKGPDTVVAAPDGRAAVAPPAPHWLATAGTGDVLSGVIASMRARGLDAFDAAFAGVWVHGRAAVRAGPGMVADDLVERLAETVADCR